MGQQADGPDERHRRPAGVSDATVAALGKLSEALEMRGAGPGAPVLVAPA